MVYLNETIKIQSETIMESILITAEPLHGLALPTFERLV